MLSRGKGRGRGRHGGVAASRSAPESDRVSYLTELLHEFNYTTSYEAKCQVLANLSNFAYDPFNYEYLRRIGALRVFIDRLGDADRTLAHFACSAVCNLCIDPANSKYIIDHNGVELITNLLSVDHEEIQLNAITSLRFLSESDSSITKNPIILQHMKNFRKSSNTRFSNLATIFLEDLCNEDPNVSDNKCNKV